MLAALLCYGSVAFGEERVPRGLSIEPVGEDWGASMADVGAILRASAKPLWRHFPDRDLAPIRVGAKGGPIVLFSRGEGGEYDVKLNTGGTYWSQYAYQFSHEFCHILCNYREGANPNAWFEEAVCELASIYSLRRMGERWKTEAPYPNWRTYADSLREYADELVEKTEVPKDLAMWYRLNRAAVEENATLREKNRVVSVAMLEIFEEEPELWGAVEFLNKAADRGSLDLPGYLRAWHENAPRRYGEGIGRIAGLFGVEVGG